MEELHRRHRRQPGQIYESIKEMIQSGSYRPGTKLIHEDVARSLDVSRTPVREAFERLRQEGYLRHEPRRGYYVNEITIEEAIDLYGVREALELYALNKIYSEIGRPDVSPLRAINERYAAAIEDQIAKTRLRVDAEFHLALAGQAGNSHLTQALSMIFERIALKMRTETYQPRLGEEALREHARLIEVLEKGDSQQAKDLLAAHIGAGRERLVAQMQYWS